ncbi:hypothetical protein GCM10023149_34010 [Mucilaginibacter gynuensis]|uniref:DoxX-like protein n=1 Tax=Mucilaginibacter gynuensis TaxID=1302236 RepID=A0ABP8GSJ4_9SPHI
MIKNVISLVLLIVSVGLSFSHGWNSYTYKKNPESLKMMSQLGLAEWTMPVFGICAVLVGLLLLIPKTFFSGNLLNALSVVFIMALALHAGNYKMALIEIPFLAIPLILIWIKYPFIK